MSKLRKRERGLGVDGRSVGRAPRTAAACSGCAGERRQGQLTGSDATQPQAGSAADRAPLFVSASDHGLRMALASFCAAALS
jgi:hypothetical protein